MHVETCGDLMMHAGETPSYRNWERHGLSKAMEKGEPMGWLEGFFATQSFEPHGHCYLWRPAILITHVASDAITALAYFSIPFALGYFVYKRKDLVYRPIFLMFAAFILACGTTHVLAIWTVWHPDYGVEGLVKFATAVFSIPTALVLWPLIPKALALPSPEALRQANSELAALNRELDQRVQERTAELARSNAELERFAYVASHDLKEPLNTTRSFLELLEFRVGQQLGESSKHLVTRALASTRRLQALIESLLEYSRAGRRVHEFAHVRMSTVVDNVRGALSNDLEDAGATVRYHGAETFFSDAALIEVVLQNLIGNAIKYRSEQPLTVTITTDVNDGEILIAVRDNGIGIVPEHHQEIFEMFKRLHNKPNIPGSGMGLAICKRMVEHLHGSISVESALGHGSTFKISLPKRTPQTARVRQGET